MRQNTSDYKYSDSDRNNHSLSNHQKNSETGKIPLTWVRESKSQDPWSSFQILLSQCTQLLACEKNLTTFHFHQVLP